MRGFKHTEQLFFSAINCSQVEVTFNTELNATAGAATANYAIKDASGATVQIDNAKLDDNKKDVTLTIGNGTAPIAFDTTKKYTVTVAKDLTKAAAPALETALVSSEVSVVDTSLPTIASVTPIGNQAVNVTFSKPVLLNATVANTFAEKQAGGTPYTVGQDYNGAGFTSATYAANSGYKQVKIEFTAKPAGEYELRIIGGATDIRDASGLNMVTANRTYTVTEATTVAQATALTVNNRTQVDVTFDAAVQVPAAASLLWGTVGTANGTVTALSPTKLRYTFTTNVIPVGSQTFTVSPTGNKVVDGYGNNVPTKTFTVDVATDDVTTATVNVVDDDTIDVIFSKQMKAATVANSTTTGEASNKTHFVLENAAGTIVDLSSITATYSEGNNVYKTTLNKANWNLAPGNYTISVSGIKDVYGDTMTAITDQAITIVDTTGPSMTGVAVAGVVAARTISITFPEAMATSGDKSIANANNYAYSADGTNYAALKAGASLVAAADGKSVVITLSSDETAITLTTSTIQIGRQAASTIYTVADVAGNIQAELPGAAGTQHAIAADATPAIAGGAATVKDATTINVAVTNKLGTVAAADFKYTVNGTTWKPVATAQLVVSAAGAHSIDFTIADTLNAKTDRTKVQVKVENATPATKSALGTAITDGDTSAVPAANLTSWPFRAPITAAEVLDNIHVKVTFNGLVGDIGVEADAGLVDLEQFIVVSGTKLADGTSAALTGYNAGPAAGNIKAARDGNSAVILTLGDALDTTKEIKVKTQDYNTTALTNWALDANGVFYEQDTTGIEATVNETLTAIDVTATLAGATVADGDTIDIIFNKVIDGTTIIAGLTPGGAAVNTVKLSISADGKLTSSNAKLGEIAGFTAPAGKTDFTTKAELSLDASGKVLTLEFKDEGSTPDTVAELGIVANGKLTYTPDAAIATPFGEKIASASKATATTLDSAPIIYAAVMTTDTNSDDKYGTVGDVLTLTFSEKVALALTDTTADANGYYDMTAAEFKNVTGMTGTGGDFKARVVDGNKVEIEVITSDISTLLDADGTVAADGEATGKLQDLAGNNQAVSTMLVKLTK